MIQNVIVKSSEKQGIGVFSLHGFKEGDAILDMHYDDVIPPAEKDKLSHYEKNHIYYIGNGNYIRMQAPEKYLNHSCDPNAYVKDGKLIAMKDIAKNEEITIDYSLNRLEPWEMECNCGSEKCRGVVKDFKRLPEEVKEAYRPYLDEWFRQELERQT